MADYQLTSNENIVVRNSDGSSIPNDPANIDYAKYRRWLDDGGVPDPYSPPPPPDPLDSWNIITLKIAFQHENRIRALEAKAPITLLQFKNAVKALL